MTLDDQGGRIRAVDLFAGAGGFSTGARMAGCQVVWMRIRERIFARDDFTCRYCGARGIAMECDHVIPVAHDDSNLVTACRDCNRSKGARTPEQWRCA
jgi:hypothetical protein